MVSTNVSKSERGHEYGRVKVDGKKTQHQELKYLTEGGASKIFKGKYEGDVVVVKRPKLANSEDMDAYHEELKLLAGLKHPNLLPLLAARAWPPDYSFVFPYMENGSMNELIHVRLKPFRHLEHCTARHVRDQRALSSPEQPPL